MGGQMGTDDELPIELIPELATRVGMVGALTQVEVGGQVCLHTGVLVVGGGG